MEYLTIGENYSKKVKRSYVQFIARKVAEKGGVCAVSVNGNVFGVEAKTKRGAVIALNSIVRNLYGNDFI